MYPRIVSITERRISHRWSKLTFETSASSRNCPVQIPRFASEFSRCTCANHPKSTSFGLHAQRQTIRTNKTVFTHRAVSKLKHVPERRATTEHPCFLTYDSFHHRATEKSVILYALFPEVFTLVATFEKELDGVLVITLRPKRSILNVEPGKELSV